VNLFKPLDLGDVASVVAVIISFAALVISIIVWIKERNLRRVISVIDLQRRWNSGLAKRRDILISLIEDINSRFENIN
jgi:hypothetical protein